MALPLVLASGCEGAGLTSNDKAIQNSKTQGAKTGGSGTGSGSGSKSGGNTGNPAKGGTSTSGKAGGQDDGGDGGTGSGASSGKTAGSGTSGNTANSGKTAGSGTSGDTSDGGKTTGASTGGTGNGGLASDSGSTNKPNPPAPTPTPPAPTFSVLTVTMAGDHDAKINTIVIRNGANPTAAPITIPWQIGSQQYPSICTENDATALSVNAQGEDNTYSPVSCAKVQAAGATAASMTMDRDCHGEYNHAETISFSCQTKKMSLVP